MLEIGYAKLGDMPSLLQVRPTPQLFARYFREARQVGTHFFVCRKRSTIVGFARLKLPHPSDKSLRRYRPLISDLYVTAPSRSQGIGTALIHHLECLAWELGHRAIHMGVDAVDNPRALALYRRLGYCPLQKKPYLKHATFYDDTGQLVERAYWRFDLRKTLTRSRRP